MAAIGSLVALTMLVAACSSDDEIQTNAVASLESESAAGVAATGESDDAGDGSADSSSDSSGDVDAEQAALDFSQCMRDEGFDFPDIGIDADGNPDIREGFDAVRGQDGFRDGFEACSEHLAGAGFGGGRAALTDNVEVQDALVEFSACIRDQGFDVGDLQFGAPGGGQGGQNGQAAQADDADGDGAAGQATDGQATGGQAANAQGGRAEGGFNPTRRLAQGLGLDPDDPDVEAAIGECQSIIDDALSAAGVTRP